jgi:hypothetical protein
MRYMSRRGLVYTAIVAPVVSVAVSWALSAATDRMFLPVGQIDELFSLFFLFLPAVVVVVVGRQLGQSAGTLWLGGFLTTVWTVVLAWIVWIGWLIVVCHDGGCFD